MKGVILVSGGISYLPFDFLLDLTCLIPLVMLCIAAVLCIVALLIVAFGSVAIAIIDYFNKGVIFHGTGCETERFRGRKS